MSTVGVVVLSLKGMKHLPECLESVKWADAILVIHAGSDEPWIASSACSSVIVRKAASAKELWELVREIKTDWILRLWGEERVEESLKEQLEALRREKLSDTPIDYRIPVRSQLLGRWVDGSLWDPSPALRLSRGAGPFSFEWWDRSVASNGRTARSLAGWIADYTLSDLSDGMEQIQTVSGLWAEYLRNQGRNLSPPAIANRSFQVFMQLLMKNRAFSKGLAGWTLSVLAAYVVLLAAAKCWEANYLFGKKVTKGYD